VFARIHDFKANLASLTDVFSVGNDHGNP